MAANDYYSFSLVLLVIIVILLIINTRIRINQFENSKDIKDALYRLIEITKSNSQSQDK